MISNGNESDDGCSNSCVVEVGWRCSGGNVSSQDVCNAICGDNVRRGSEQCDDGNMNDNDGCSSSCLIESSFVMSESYISGDFNAL